MFTAIQLLIHAAAAKLQFAPTCSVACMTNIETCSASLQPNIQSFAKQLPILSEKPSNFASTKSLISLRSCQHVHHNMRIHIDTNSKRTYAGDKTPFLIPSFFNSRFTRVSVAHSSPTLSAISIAHVFLPPYLSNSCRSFAVTSSDNCRLLAGFLEGRVPSAMTSPTGGKRAEGHENDNLPYTEDKPCCICRVRSAKDVAISNKMGTEKVRRLNVNQIMTEEKIGGTVPKT